MRTTLSLDPDVAILLARVRHSRKASLKDVVNEALRQGLEQMTRKTGRRGRYRTPPVSLGRCRVGSLDDVSEALALAEGEAFR
jgi:hypothetical protein